MELFPWQSIPAIQDTDAGECLVYGRRQRVPSRLRHEVDAHKAELLQMHHVTLFATGLNLPCGVWRGEMTLGQSPFIHSPGPTPSVYISAALRANKPRMHQGRLGVRSSHSHLTWRERSQTPPRTTAALTHPDRPTPLRIVPHHGKVSVVHASFLYLDPIPDTTIIRK